MKEEWKDILGFEGLYKISNRGKVFSLTTKKSLKLYNHAKGYLQVVLSKK